MQQGWKDQMTELFGARCARCAAEGPLAYASAPPHAATIRRMWAVVPLCPACRALVERGKMRRFEAAGSDVRSLLLLGAVQLYAQRSGGC